MKLKGGKGKRVMEEGMKGAARGGNLDLVEFFISKGATNFKESIFETYRNKDALLHILKNIRNLLKRESITIKSEFLGNPE